MSVRPEVHLRIGTHAEKEYFLKLGDKFDAIIVQANLFEATSTGTAALLIALQAKTAYPAYSLDPMTYIFGLDPQYLMSTSRGKLTVKRSYRQIADSLGAPLTRLVGKRAVRPGHFKPETQRAFAAAVARYQDNRVRAQLEDDPFFAAIAEDVAPKPAFLWAPYFYIDGHLEWLSTCVQLAAEFLAVTDASRVAVPLLLSEGLLSPGNRSELHKVIDAFSPLKPAAFLLWVSDLIETGSGCGKDQIRQLILLIRGLSESGAKVINLHGGFLSLCLTKFGLSGISHSVGYGEHKHVTPVIGGGLPPEKYYLNPLHQKFAVPEVLRAIRALGSQAFFEEICSCPICRGVIDSDLSSLSKMGETYQKYSKKMRKDYDVATPESIKLCRYHYLLARLSEVELVARSSVEDLIGLLRKQHEFAEKSPVLGYGPWPYLSVWADALDEALESEEKGAEPS